MGKMTIDEQFSSTAVAVYNTNSLFARFKSDADLEPEDGSPLPLAIPTHVHEFVHYLHNISTTAGVRLVFLMHTLVFMGATYLMEHGRGVGKTSNKSPQDHNFKFFIDHINFINGAFEKKCEEANGREGWFFSNLHRYDEKCPEGFLAYQIDVFGARNKKVESGVLRIGLYFLTEGVAYEVEREVWRKKKVDVISIDAGTPFFPYLAYGPLVNYLVGRETTSMERIEIGNAALLHESPSQGFVDGCMALRKGRFEFDKYLKGRVEGFKKYIDDEFDSTVQKLAEFYSNTDKLLKPFMAYMSVVKTAALKRVLCPILEEVFFKEDIDKEEFFQITSSIAEHLVIQERVGAPVKIDLVGHPAGLASHSNDDIQWFYLLCCAIHFVQQHLKLDGTIEETEKLRAKSCPFSGGCEVEASEGYPEACKKSPWKFARDVGAEKKGVCWYTASLVSITPDPKSLESFNLS